MKKRFEHFCHDGENIDLEIVTRGLGLRSLHFGLWQDGQPLTVKEMARAQAFYTETLIGMFPALAQTVLDIGAGIGDNAIHMAEKGLHVTCISPSTIHQRHFKEHVLPEHEDIVFIRSTYEELDLDSRFDVVLMSESSNYFPIEHGLERTLRYLKGGGVLVMGALMRKDNHPRYEEMHPYQSYLDLANRKGFILKEDVDVTEQVIPTLDLAHSVFQYVPSVAEVLLDFNRRSAGVKYQIVSAIARLFFGRELFLLNDLVFNAGPHKTDPEPFREHVTYRFLMFEKP